MTVPITQRLVEHPGDGVEDTFSYTFRILAATHLTVSLINDTTEVETLQVLGVDYSVTGVQQLGGGTVIMTDPPPTGTTLRIQRIVPLLQLTDLQNAGSYFPTSVENECDWLMMAIQQLAAGNFDFGDLIAFILNLLAELKLTQYTTATRPPADAAHRNWLIALRDEGQGPTLFQWCSEAATPGTFHWITVAGGLPF